LTHGGIYKGGASRFRFANSEWHSVDVDKDRALEADLDGGFVPFVKLEHG